VLNNWPEIQKGKKGILQEISPHYHRFKLGEDPARKNGYPFKKTTKQQKAPPNPPTIHNSTKHI